MNKFTVFTGTYNSENIIDRVFQSITEQTYNNFEWIVIDDCSKDNTVVKIKAFQEKNPDIPITLIQHKRNTGVSTSRKEAIELAKGTYFVTWDHDDVQDKDQLKVFNDLWSTYDDKSIAFIFAKIKDQKGNILGSKFPRDPYIINYLHVYNSYLVAYNKNVVEHHVCSKTEKYKEVLSFYADNPGLMNGRLPNGADIWAMMSYLGYNTIFSNTVVRTYFVNEMGRNSMSSAKRNENPDRIFRNKLLWVNYFDKKLDNKNNWKFKLRNIFAVTFYGLLAKKSILSIVDEIPNNITKLFVFIFSVPAKILAFKYARQ